MISPTTTLYITDKTEKVMFKTLCGTGYYRFEENNLKRKLIEAASNPEEYHFLDLETAKIVIIHNKNGEK